MAEGTGTGDGTGVDGGAGSPEAQEPKRLKQPRKVSSGVKEKETAIAKVSGGKTSLATLPFKGTLKYAASMLPGGKTTFLEYARLSVDPKVKELIHRWDTLSHSQKARVTLDDLCIAVDVPPVDLLKEVAGIAFSMNVDISNLIAAIHQPRVVDRTIKAAMRADGVDDRRMLHQHSGFLPAPRGAQINVSTTVSAQAAAAAKNTVQGEESGLPDFENDAAQTVSALRGDESE